MSPFFSLQGDPLLLPWIHPRLPALLAQKPMLFQCTKTSRKASIYHKYVLQIIIESIGLFHNGAHLIFLYATLYDTMIACTCGPTIHFSFSMSQNSIREKNQTPYTIQIVSVKCPKIFWKHSQIIKLVFFASWKYFHPYVFYYLHKTR